MKTERNIDTSRPQASDEEMKSYSEEMVRRDEAGATREASEDGGEEETADAGDGAGRRGNPPH